MAPSIDPHEIFGHGPKKQEPKERLMPHPPWANFIVSVILSTCLLVTYLLVIPTMIKSYEGQLDLARVKLNTVLERVELHQQRTDKAAEALLKVHIYDIDNNDRLKVIEERNIENNTILKTLLEKANAQDPNAARKKDQ